VTALTGVREHRHMIRNVVIHASNEQPLLADLFDLPSADDAGLLCTNLRMMDGKRPVFIDQIESTFFFPYHVIRFLEIPKGAAPAAAKSRRKGPAAAASADEDPEPQSESLLPIALGGPSEANGEGDLDIDIEIDEDFLQRVRDI
jgi:hypothetical protein